MTALDRKPILEVRGLTSAFFTDGGKATVVDELSFDLHEGEILGIVGESGSGKSVTFLSLMGLLPERSATIEAGSARFEGRDLIGQPQSELRKIRGDKIAFIFQEPMTSLNPVLTIGRQVSEAMIAHGLCTAAEAKAAAVEALRAVQIPEPETRYHHYPHEFSGGMLQRAMIAMALACRPKILIADEPTTALDVTIQAQVLSLIRKLRNHAGMSIILITHDLGVIAEMADRVVVMYGGRKMEEASVFDLFERPRHPYTAGLLAANPSTELAQIARPDGGHRLRDIPGSLPPPTEVHAGCNFMPRCPLASETCGTQRPQVREVAPGHAFACWNA